WRRARGQAIDRGEEGGEGLARAGGGDHERVVPTVDGLPRRGLRGGGRIERFLEPPRRGGGEGGRERLAGHGHRTIVDRPADSAPGRALVTALRGRTLPRCVAAWQDGRTAVPASAGPALTTTKG